MNILAHVSTQFADDSPPRWLWVPIACAWLLMLMTFSAPEREGPESVGSLDAIALAKLGVRVLVLGALGSVLLNLANHARWSLILGLLAPFGLFVIWAIVSTLWSPLKSVSLGQVSGLLVQVMLAAVLGIVCSQPAARRLLLKHLSLALLTISSIILCVALVDLELSGLDRTFEHEGASGIVHPTSAGATSGLGLLILLAAHLMWHYRWARYLIWPGFAIHGAVLLLANSRTSAGMTLTVMLIIIGCYGYRVALTAATLIGCTLGTLYLASDAHLRLAHSMLNTTASYAQRGETAEQLTSFTGRTALWEAIWKEYQKSILLGHGYFVTSETGELDVWAGPANRTAHNVLLQVLVSTGLIGTVLFLWALIGPIVKMTTVRRESPDQRTLGAFLLLLGLWYLGWGQLCESFMGPIQPESVIFFSLFGLGLGLIPTHDAQDDSLPDLLVARLEMPR